MLPADHLHRVLSTLKLKISAGQIEQLLTYAQDVLTQNAITNLTGAKTVAEFIDGPLFDGLTVVPLLPDDTQILDIGSGGGLPAIPVWICRPKTKLTLVEPRLKRAQFLMQLNDRYAMGANVQQTQDRQLPRHHFSAAMAQAVFPPDKWLVRARQLLAPGGCAYVMSSQSPDTVKHPKNARIVQQQCYTRPADNASRWTWAVQFDA